MLILKALISLCPLSSAVAVTVYGQIPFGHVTQSQAQASATAGGATPTATPLAAYDNTVLKPMPLPDQPPPTRWTLELQDSGVNVPNLSIRMPGSFYGFSIEMSVITQVVGKNSTQIHVPFLNLLSNIIARGGTIRIRMGGNTQEFASFVGELPADSNGRALEKVVFESGNTTPTPAVLYSMDYLYMMANISALLNVGWYAGIPFNQTKPFRLDIVEHIVPVLGDHLLGLQAGNEPDLYASHLLREPPLFGPYQNEFDNTYRPKDYFDEFAELIKQMEAKNMEHRNRLIGPSVSFNGWKPELVWETGYIDAYKESLGIIAVERYPTNNCAVKFNTGAQPIDPQSAFFGYLSHNAATNLVGDYLESSRLALQAQRPLVMFETNTAACGGFPGVSDTMGATLWGLDYGMQMAHANFSGALLHVGGQNVYYNPFTAPPTNQSGFDQWSVGAIYYSALIMAEAFGKSNTSQIIDMKGNNGDVNTPQYAIYENGKLAKVALFNFMTDPTGAHDYTAALHLNGAGAVVPAQVHVKYLTGSSVSLRADMRWAGQTFGDRFKADGRLQGELNVTTIDCEVDAKQCLIPVPAPGFALVFFSTDNLNDATPNAEQVQTFATSARTKVRNTATIDAAVLATSNGHSGKDRDVHLGSTSVKGQNGAISMIVTGLTAVLAVSCSIVTLTFIW